MISVNTAGGISVVNDMIMQRKNMKKTKTEYCCYSIGFKWNIKALVKAIKTWNDEDASNQW